jgi:maltooligosyltrehalose trehalohydrolase
MTGENEGYMGFFKGTMEEMLKTLREGWLFTGEAQKDGIPRGTAGADIEPEHFVHCISNHDQVGNRAYGERLSQSVSPEAYRAASALLLICPYTPMIFMGQEWASSSPFLYFTDHHDELGKGVTEGRRKEFAQFSEFKNVAKRSKIPNPQAVSTFKRSKLKWAELEKSPHRATLDLYRSFVEFRKTDLKNRSRDRWEVGQISNHAIAIRYQRSMTGDILVIFQLVPDKVTIDLDQELLKPGKGRAWDLAASTNHVNYGGNGAAELDRAGEKLALTLPELIVLREEAEQIG